MDAASMYPNLIEHRSSDFLSLCKCWQFLVLPKTQSPPATPKQYERELCRVPVRQLAGRDATKGDESRHEGELNQDREDEGR